MGIFQAVFTWELKTETFCSNKESKYTMKWPNSGTYFYSHFASQLSILFWKDQWMLTAAITVGS